VLRRSGVIALLSVASACSAPAAQHAAERPGAGRRVAPDGVCTSAASARGPCNLDPDPCHIDTGFPGDEMCLPPPPPELGVQIHFGPSDYGNPEQVNRYLLAQGVELNSLGIANIPTDRDHFFDFVQLRARPGLHHLINRAIGKYWPEGFVPGMPCPAPLASDYFVGTQTIARDDPARGIVAPENAGLGRVLPGDASLCLNIHAYNFSVEPVLTEIWINVYFMDPRLVTERENRIALNADVGLIPPGAQRTASASAPIVGDGRIINLYGHRHAATRRFAVWLNDRLIYDSRDWLESAVFEFNSVTQNPPLDPAAATDGAFSGTLPVRDGDQLRIQCDIDNQSEQPLRFSNEVFTGEMCILFGATVGAKVDAPGLPL
jgi:hypothetical protein